MKKSTKKQFNSSICTEADKKPREKRRFNKETMYIVSATVMAAMLLPFSIFATNASGSIAGLTGFANFFSDIVKIIGFCIGAYGATVLGPGLSQHDSAQIKMGLMVFAGAIVMFFHREILALMGITI